jgi:hypothetical protein
MAGFEELIASPGEKILPKWGALLSWIRRQRVQAPGARVTYGPGGAQVVFDPVEYVQQVRFRVSLTGEATPRVTVGDGTINGIVPKVDGVPITGLEIPPTPSPKIAIARPDDDGIALILIETTHAANGNLAAATIVSKRPADIPGGMRADYLVQGKGNIPIAIVRHNLQTRQPESVFQHSVHNLQCRLYDSGQGMRLIYWAA